MSLAAELRKPVIISLATATRCAVANEPSAQREFPTDDTTTLLLARQRKYFRDDVIIARDRVPTRGPRESQEERTTKSLSISWRQEQRNVQRRKQRIRPNFAVWPTGHVGEGKRRLGPLQPINLPVRDAANCSPIVRCRR